MDSFLPIYPYSQEAYAGNCCKNSRKNKSEEVYKNPKENKKVSFGEKTTKDKIASNSISF